MAAAGAEGAFGREGRGRGAEVARGAEEACWASGRAICLPFAPPFPINAFPSLLLLLLHPYVTSFTPFFSFTQVLKNMSTKGKKMTCPFSSGEIPLYRRKQWEWRGVKGGGGGNDMFEDKKGGEGVGPD